jgi:hypothetical protein
VSRDTSGNLQYNTLKTLKDRRNRFGHCPNPISAAVFPFPIYTKSTGYYFRLPLLEETVHTDWAINGNVGYGLPTGTPTLPAAIPPYIPAIVPQYHPNPSDPVPATFLDFWDAVKCFPDAYTTTGTINTQTGSLLTEDIDASTPGIQRSHRCGEDIILKNVLSFDVKVWNPYWVPLSGGTWAEPQYVDLGQDRLFDATGRGGGTNQNVPFLVNYAYVGLPNTYTGTPGLGCPPNGAPIGFGSTSKGHYGGVSGAGSIKLLDLGIYDGTTPPTSSDTTYWTTPPMPCVFDSWTKDYETNANDYRPNVNTSGVSKNGPATLNDSTLWACPPPYEMDLTSIQITIRCFDPESKNIRQVRVVHHFP